MASATQPLPTSAATPPAEPPSKQPAVTDGSQPPEFQTTPEVINPPQVPFFRQPWVQKTLPLATSLLLHLTIIIVGLTIFTVAPIITRAIKDQVIIPDSTIVNDAPVGGVTNPGLGSDPNRAAAQDKVETADTTGLNDKKTESLTASLAGGGATDGASDNVIGLGAHAGIGSGGGVGAAMGAGTGAGTGDGGAMSPFGVPGGGGGLGPKSPFMGISGNGRKIVYLVDASGSMLTVFARVKRELMTSIGHLQPIQAFNIIVFHKDESEMTTMSRSGLLIANPNNKLAAAKFVEDQGAMGGTDPIPGIKLAFNQKPDLIYVLTDGFDNVDSFQAIIDLFHNLNTSHARVNAIMLKSREDPELEKVLKTISGDSGGILKVVDEKEF